ncbi:hypothetical protein [endosymbiont 'TC1' of Trimyema compressum]|uniref:hypothetical protein n=1 Tax=endosymbiont 'TC1' of Trimyema compressum TaxID=243899 RepID=UPI0013921F94|nr:hypothetical protein [endosymbiont 'TC1' of Trimyema compressum]
MLNSSQNIDYVFELERTTPPQEKVLLGGIYAVVDESVYDIVKDEAKVYATCFYPQHRAMTTEGVIDVERAQQIAYDVITYLAEKFQLKGTYTARNVCSRQAVTNPNDLVK